MKNYPMRRRSGVIAWISCSKSWEKFTTQWQIFNTEIHRDAAHREPTERSGEFNNPDFPLPLINRKVTFAAYQKKPA